jgi:hypothetical protein
MYTLYYIDIFNRGCRLGANILNYISQIVYAHKNNYYIKYDKNFLRFKNSIFIKSLFSYVDNYNLHLLENYDIDRYFIDSEELNLQKINIDTVHFVHIISMTTMNISSDIISYFKKHIFPNIEEEFEKLATIMNYTTLDVSKKIVVHLRLDDVRNVRDYDGSICSNYYADRINNGQSCFHTNLYDGLYNQQAPLSKEKLMDQITTAQKKYPDYKVVLVTNPGETVDLPFQIIQNDDPNFDLYLLCKSEVLILSRSTFTLASLFFGRQKEVYIPLWGHAVCLGIYTKYDNSKFNYFF